MLEGLMTDTALSGDPAAPDTPRQGRFRFELDPIKAARAALALKESIAAVTTDDDELLADMIEGETDLFEIIDRLIARRAENMALAAGAAQHIETMRGRRERFERLAEQDRTLITQAMVIAELPSVRRPVATLSLSARAAKLVIDDEAAIPSSFWKAGDPKLDKSALAEAVRAHATARAEAIAALPQDPDARAEAIAGRPPEIPGAHLEAAPPSLTIRER
jgi:hypothetical protein